MNVSCKRVSEKDIRDAWLAQIISHIAAKHGCSVKIDWNTYTINFDGPESAKSEIAHDLTVFFD